MVLKDPLRLMLFNPKATIFNHDCVPTACRFDYVDSTNDDYEHSSTNIIVRLIEDVDEGKEVCISYFRIGRDYCTRKRILMEEYVKKIYSNN